MLEVREYCFGNQALLQPHAQIAQQRQSSSILTLYTDTKTKLHINQTYLMHKNIIGLCPILYISALRLGSEVCSIIS